MSMLVSMCLLPCLFADGSYLDHGIKSQVFIFYLKVVFIPPKARGKGMRAALGATKTDFIAPFSKHAEVQTKKWRIGRKGLLA